MRKGTVLAVLLVLAVAVGAAAALLTRNAGSPLEMYLKAEKKALNDISKLLKDTYKANYDKKGLAQNDKYSSRHEIAASTAGNALETLGIPSADIVGGVLGKLKLRLDSTVEYKLGESLTDITLYINESPALLGQLFSNGKELYLGADTLFPDTWFKLGASESEVPVTKLSSPSDFSSRLDNALSGIYESIKNTVTKENITESSKGNPKTVTIAGDKVNVNSISIKLDPASTKALLDDMAAKLDEAKVLNAFDTQLLQYFSMFMPEMPKDDVKVKELLDNFIKDREISEGLAMDLLVDNTGSVLERKASLTIKDTDSKPIALEIYMTSGDKSGYVPTNGKTRVVMYYSVNDVDYIDDITAEANLDLSKSVPEGDLSVTYKPTGGDGKGGFTARLEVGPENAAKGNTAAGSAARTMGTISLVLDSSEPAGEASLIFAFTEEELPEVEYEAPEFEGKKIYDLQSMTAEEKEELAKQLNVAIAMFMLSTGSLF